MGRRADKPARAVTVTTYGEIDAIFFAFHRGELGLLIVEPGTQKSDLASAAHDRTTVVAGRNSPLGVYRASCNAWGRSLVLDDVDGLMHSPAGPTLLKELWSTEAVEKVAWNTSRRSSPPRASRGSSARSGRSSSGRGLGRGRQPGPFEFTGAYCRGDASVQTLL